MTGSDDSSSSTRPISVAELLAKNGTIGAPPVGGRRRRRRGNADAVTVAELTGEIPIIRPDDPPPAPAPETPDIPEPADEAVEADGAPPAVPDEEPADEADAAETVEAPADDVVEADEPATEEAGETEVEEVDQTEVDEGDADETDEYADAVAAYAARKQLSPTDEETDTEEEAEPEPSEPARRFGFGRFGRKNPEVDAETWTPDPVDGHDDPTALTDEPVELEDLDAEAAVEEERTGTAEDEDDRDELPSYLRSTEEPLFGGHSVADDALRGETATLDDEDDLDAGQDEPRTMSSLVHGLWIVGQSVIAVVFGAGLFVAFDQLWKWNNIVALVLSVLVILGLVVGVRVVRKTEDIGSTLIAVAVGALVTLGPLALLQSG
ncbi:hypothetical protein PDG61_12555 [Mycolicibacterium sp. BiH015]|uniref:hypothetical protein n=1 Tax=Mycolicibacterium sp. BiH015 TaxID=3018808 RepID=UPI0022E6C271|nr:hypothetical protein [Mycolicibacterium sp. BiH015]MDA2891747.1 hypothetical protein [Mycolicibacterium sp. BiH015]